uniref:Uncharacterized protein n=1 Tax=virus sp. ctEQ64 TaxID=2825809 RepID=A0A8S5RKG5_9VIRU|nr:MAG TPA: hypothetical protein [virus sp. ctEQ64]
MNCWDILIRTISSEIFNFFKETFNDYPIWE